MSADSYLDIITCPINPTHQLTLHTSAVAIVALSSKIIISASTHLFRLTLLRDNNQTMFVFPPPNWVILIWPSPHYQLIWRIFPCMIWARYPRTCWYVVITVHANLIRNIMSQCFLTITVFLVSYEVILESSCIACCVIFTNQENCMCS